VVFARRYHVKREVILGYAIAHELGHLLLPPNSHSVGGIMRASLDMKLAAAQRLRFTGDQGRLIVAALPQNCCDARRAPSAIAASLPHTTSGSTAAWPTQVP
jgi:hypothetical protein